MKYNVKANIAHTLQGLSAVIYSGLVLYTINANISLWCVWFFLHLCYYLNNYYYYKHHKEKENKS